jgi:hypothetical protein
MTENTALGSANVHQAAHALRILVENALSGGAGNHQLLIDELSRLSRENFNFLRQLRRSLRESARDGIQIEIWSSTENLGPAAGVNRIQLVGTSSEHLISASSKYVWKNLTGQSETSAGFVLALPSACRNRFDELFLLTEKLFQERALLNSSHYNCNQAA